MKIELKFDGAGSGKKIIIGIAVIAVLGIGYAVWKSGESDRYLERSLQQAREADQKRDREARKYLFGR